MESIYKTWYMNLFVFEVFEESTFVEDNRGYRTKQKGCEEICTESKQVTFAGFPEKDIWGHHTKQKDCVELEVFEVTFWVEKDIWIRCTEQEGCLEVSPESHDYLATRAGDD